MTKNLDPPELLRRRLKAQADLFAALTSHPTLIGTGREEALAELLRQFMPRRFEVLGGAVAVVDDDERPVRSTHQLDMIVADTTDFPTLLRSGNVAIVLAQSVRAVMEVKSDLKRGASFVTALAQIARARQLLLSVSGFVFIGLFSFGAPTQPETLRDWLGDVVALRQLLATKQGDPSIVRIRDAMLNTEGGMKVANDENELLALLANDNLPDVIAADRGAVAYSHRGSNVPSSYAFTGGRHGVSSVMILIDQLIERLGAEATPSIHGALAAARAHLAVDRVAIPVLEDLSLPEPVLCQQ